MARSRPATLRALWWVTLVDEGVLRKWLVNIGVRTARECVAHLICELRERMRNIDRVDQGQFATPLTQPYLAEALGLTADHLNRVVRQFSKNGIFELGRGQVKVFDLAALTEIAGFDPSYLTLSLSIARDRRCSSIYQFTCVLGLIHVRRQKGDC